MEYEIHPIDLAALAQTVAEEFEVQARERNIQLAVDSTSDASADCDRDRIVQVLGNLFENALKFAPEGSAIAARIQHNEDGKLLVSVTDSGPGVPDEHKTRIFEKFHQVKKGKKIAGQGVGLGLAICKTIIEAHQGSIWVEDNPTGGSVFSFTLSAHHSSSAESNDSITVAGQSR